MEGDRRAPIASALDFPAVGSELGGKEHVRVMESLARPAAGKHDMDHAELLAMIQRHEGLRLAPYQDTVGKWTIGYGRNLSDVGISRGEAVELLQHDVDAAIADLATFPWFLRMDDVRRAALVDFRFNVGAAGLRKFHKMLAALEADDYTQAAAELQASKWFTQVGGRGPELVQMLAEGENA